MMKFTLLLRDENGILYEVKDNMQEYQRNSGFNKMEVYNAIHDTMEEANKHYEPKPEIGDLPPRHMQDLPPKPTKKKRRGDDAEMR